MTVLSFRVEQKRSKYSILHVESSREIVTGYHGLIWADTDTARVMKITIECDTIPADFAIRQVSEILNDDF